MQEEWEAIQVAYRNEAEFCETAAGLGWDPYDMDDDEHSLVVEFARTLSRAVLEEAVAAFNARNLLTECSAVSSAICRAKAKALRLKPLAAMNHELPPDSYVAPPTPWAAGYNITRELRRALNLDGRPLPSIKRIAEAINEEPAWPERVTEPVEFEGAALVDGVITRNDNLCPAFAFRGFSSEENRRFNLRRALAEAFTSPGTYTLITKAHSERQQRNCTFATEFLAPSSSLKQRVSRMATTSTSWRWRSVFRRG